MKKSNSRSAPAGPRYSIIPGDFVEDPRADVNHFRVMNYIGRHTDNNGWCRLKQITIGKAIDLARETVNRKLKDLVEWDYVEASGATGRSLWYRVIMDRGNAPENSHAEIADCSDDVFHEVDDRVLQGAHSSKISDVSEGSHVGYNSYAGDDQKRTTDVTSADHSSCDHTQSHRTDSLTTFSNDPPPQSPARGGRGSGKKVDDVDSALRDLISEGPADELRRFAVESILRPIVVSRKFDGASLEHGLRGLANWVSARGLNAGEAARVVDRILETRRSTVKPSDIEDEVKAVLGCRPQVAALTGDAASMAKWPAVLAILSSRLGVEKVSAWFSTIVVDGVSQVRVDLATHLPHIAKFVDQEFSAQLRLALETVYGVPTFNLIARKVAA